MVTASGIGVVFSSYQQQNQQPLCDLRASHHRHRLSAGGAGYHSKRLWLPEVVTATAASPSKNLINSIFFVEIYKRLPQLPQLPLIHIPL